MIQYQLIIKYRKVYTMLELRNLKNNNQEYFKLKETSKDIYFIDHYCRSQKKYCCCKFEDVNFSRYFKSDKEVFIDFEF
jgi:hypothetical protein